MQVVGGVDNAVAVEVEKRHLTAAGGFVEGGAEGEVVAGVDDGQEIGSRRPVRGSGRGTGVADWTVKQEEA